MYAEISAAIQSAKVMADLIKTARSLANYNELVAAVSEVNSKLMEATAVALASQEKQSSLAGRVAELEAELLQLRQQQQQTNRYQLHEFPITGALAYRIKLGSEEGEPLHYLCAACMDQGEMSKLQPFNGKRSLRCCRCKVIIHVEPDPPHTRRRMLSRGLNEARGLNEV